MTEWIDVATVDEITDGGCEEVIVDDIRVAVFRLGGEYFAVDAICTHDYGELAEGAVEDGEVVCPRHGARFDIRTGAATAPPAFEPLATYPVRIHHRVIQVGTNRDAH